MVRGARRLEGDLQALLDELARDLAGEVQAPADGPGCAEKLVGRQVEGGGHEHLLLASDGAAILAFAHLRVNPVALLLRRG